jgi:hypothetical protein
MWWSVAAFVLFAFLGIAGMGALSAMLVVFASPFLNLCFPPLDSWRGDWVWPIMVVYGVIWPLSFLVAGFLDRLWKRRGRGRGFRWAVYLGVLYAGAVITGYALLPGQLPMHCL